jgi:DNA-directed RNA polymerase specialized sigma24 family protein
MTEKELDLRHWLNRAFYADKKAKALDMLVSQCRERATGLVRYSEGNDTGKSGTSKNGTESALMKLAEMEEKAECQKAEAVKVSAEIQDAISMLHDDDLEAVLIHRYLNFLTIEQTAEIMNYHPNTVKAKVKTAVQKICTEMS